MVRYATESNDIYAFSRTVDEKTVLVIVNLGKDAADVKFVKEAPVLDNLVNYFTGEVAEIPAKLAAGEYLVFVNK